MNYKQMWEAQAEKSERLEKKNKVLEAENDGAKLDIKKYKEGSKLQNNMIHDLNVIIDDQRSELETIEKYTKNTP